MAIGKRDVHRYLDGELSPRRARRVYQALKRDQALQQETRQLAELGAVLRESSEAAAAETDFSQLVNRVRRDIAQQHGPGLIERVGTFFRRFALVLAGGVAAALIVGLLLWPTAAPPSNDCEIETLEVGEGAISTIFEIPSADDADATTVVWVDEGEVP
jgi:anti-sigma factor RsiW